MTKTPDREVCVGGLLLAVSRCKFLRISALTRWHFPKPRKTLTLFVANPTCSLRPMKASMTVIRTQTPMLFPNIFFILPT